MSGFLETSDPTLFYERERERERGENIKLWVLGVRLKVQLL